MDLRYLLIPLLSLSSTLLLQTATAFTPKDSIPVTRSYNNNKIFHQATGLCVLKKSSTSPLKLGPCTHSDAWYYTPQKFLTIRGTYFCLQAVGPAQPTRLSINCTPIDSQWTTVVSSSEGSGNTDDDNNNKTHLATKLADDTTVCLDVNSDDHTIISNPCAGFGIEGDSQWFKIIAGEKKSITITV